jgi:hypothetical protein
VVPANRNTEDRLDGIPAVHPDFAKVAKGGYGGGRPAYGYKAAGGALVVNNEESVVLETVFNNAAWWIFLPTDRQCHVRGGPSLSLRRELESQSGETDCAEERCRLSRVSAAVLLC